MLRRIWIPCHTWRRRRRHQHALDSTLVEDILEGCGRPMSTWLNLGGFETTYPIYGRQLCRVHIIYLGIKDRQDIRDLPFFLSLHRIMPSCCWCTSKRNMLHNIYNEMVGCTQVHILILAPSNRRSVQSPSSTLVPMILILRKDPQEISILIYLWTLIFLRTSRLRSISHYHMSRKLMNI